MPPWLDRLAAFVARGWTDAGGAGNSDQEFDELALVMHAWQARRVPVVARMAPAAVRTWRDIPALPVSLFAEHDLFAWPVDEATGFYLSSGTTRETRGRHWHRDLSLYRASCLAGARWALGEAEADTGGNPGASSPGRRGWNVRSLAPRESTSSLAAMIEALAVDLAPSPGDEAEAPVLVIGPAFAYVPVIESGRHGVLPPGSVVVETGGFKGRTRTVAREELHAGIASAYGVPRERIIGEYGMCELSSPLWERVGLEAGGEAPLRGFSAAPWVRVRLLDPETLEDADRGLVAIWDLANWQSSLGLMTADLGHWNAERRLVIEGRLPGAPPKGCSLTVSG